MAGNQPRQLARPYPEPGALCHEDDITNHTTGQYCVTCKRIKMPWGALLPISRYQGLPVSVGRLGTILQAVKVDSPREIILVGLAAWAITTDQWQDALKINRSIERGSIKAAAHAITDIAFASAQKSEIAEEKWWDILHDALMNPELTVAGYKARIHGLVAPRVKPKLELKSSQPIVLPDEDDEQEEDDQDLDYDDADKIPEGKKLLFLSRVETDKDDEDGVMEEKERQISPWQFAPGQDLDPAYWGTPDTSKFFMVRQLREDPSKINVREYPQIAGFDWNDKEAVQALNRGRNQIIFRTNGPKAAPRLPWSQKEKDLLRHQVIMGLKNGYTRKNMPWEQVANNINVDLQGVIQRKGSPLARSSRWNIKKDQEDFYAKRNLTILGDRTGSERTATGCMNQAHKFGDIDTLLRNSVETSSRRKSLEDMLKIVLGSQISPPIYRADSFASSKQVMKVQNEDKRGLFTDESSSAQNLGTQNNIIDPSLIVKPLVKRVQSYDAAKMPSTNSSVTKRWQSYQSANKSPVNEHLVKRRKSEHGQ